jgi:hypothetical protein
MQGVCSKHKCRVFCNHCKTDINRKPNATEEKCNRGKMQQKKNATEEKCSARVTEEILPVSSNATTKLVPIEAQCKHII